jgi:hypothetical protein
VIDLLQTLQTWLIAHSRMFAYVGMVGVGMAFGIPLFLGILAGSKQKQEERIRVLAKARADYQKGGDPWCL